MDWKNALPKSVNWAALYAVKQGQTETPTEFLHRLKAAMFEFTTLDHSWDEGKQQISSLFLGQSSEDMRKKLRKIKEPDKRDIEKLLEEAWRMYRSEQVDKKRIEKTIVSATAAALGQNWMLN